MSSELLIRLIFISLGSAFISNVVTKQNGPLMVFSAFRMTVGKTAGQQAQNVSNLVTSGSLSETRMKWELRKNKLLKSAGEIVTCPFCLGPWIVLLWLLILDSFTFTNWFSGCGLLYIFLGVINGHSGR